MTKERGIGNIIMINATDGEGKTYQINTFPEELVILDIDGKAEKTVKKFYPDKLITIKPVLAFHKKSDVSKNILRGNLDVDVTLKNIFDGVSDILDNMESYETICVDGISDLKRIVGQHWLLHDKKGRKAIGDNLSARTEINTTVKEKMIYPLINLARELDKTLILTSKMADTYISVEGDDGKMHNVKSGSKEPDAAEWIPYKADVKVTLKREQNGKYFLYWNRAPQKDLPIREDITDKNLYDIMKYRGVL